MTPYVEHQEGMMQHKILDLHLIAHLEFAVLALCNPIMIVAKILHPHHSVWQIGYLDNGIWQQVGRADFLIRGVKVRVSLILNLRQLFPMGIAQIAGNGIKSTGMGRAFILGKAHESFQCRGTNTDTRLALNIE